MYKNEKNKEKSIKFTKITEKLQNFATNPSK